MKVIETFVSASVHEKDGKKFIRVRFQTEADKWMTAFNPQGIASVEWVQRVSKSTGNMRTQTRFPVQVSFVEPKVIGSDVCDKCIIAPRDFVPASVAQADANDLAVLANAVVKSSSPATAPATAPIAEETLA